MEGFALDHFNKFKTSTIPMAQFHSNLSDKSGQYSITTATHICILLHFLLKKQVIGPLFTTMWDHTDGFSNQYRCISSIYLL